MGVPDGSWLVSYFRHDADGEPQLETRIPETSLDLAFDHAPFPDMQDDNWSLKAHASFERPAGRYEFTIVTSGAVEIRANGTIVCAAGDLPSVQTAKVLFDHAGGPIGLEVSAEDRAGQFVLTVIP
ncbi:MAG: hypothetical protein IIB57_10975 [Planctomycetes bacterium]|nr:hypothetical protein [Planctomycetota bacterium]